MLRRLLLRSAPTFFGRAVRSAVPTRRLLSTASASAPRHPTQPQPHLRLPLQTRLQSPLLKELTAPTAGIQAAILDWSGTTADEYVIAPAVVFQEVFAKKGVPITMEEARKPMGLRKDLHIAAIASMDTVKKRWFAKHGRDISENDVADMFKDFVPAQLACLPLYSTLIPGTVEAVNALRTQGIKTGASTGFTRAMVDVLYHHAKQQGLKLDCTVAGDEVLHGGRPNPFMVFRNMDLLGVAHPRFVVKVDDTVTGVGEGLNAGCWTVALYDYSNYVNVNSLEEAKTISSTELARRRAYSRIILEGSGAHYVVPSIRDLPDVIKDINHRLSLGESPILERQNYRGVEVSAVPTPRTSLR